MTPVASFLSTQTLPFYVFSESYGGKMAAAFGLALYNVHTYVTNHFTHYVHSHN